MAMGLSVTLTVTLSCWAGLSCQWHYQTGDSSMLSSLGPGSSTGIFVPEGAWAGGPDDDGTTEYLHLEICCPPALNSDRGHTSFSLWRYVSRLEWPVCFLFYLWVHLLFFSVQLTVILVYYFSCLFSYSTFSLSRSRVYNRIGFRI